MKKSKEEFFNKSLKVDPRQILTGVTRLKVPNAEKF